MLLVITVHQVEKVVPFHAFRAAQACSLQRPGSLFVALVQKGHLQTGLEILYARNVLRELRTVRLVNLPAQTVSLGDIHLFGERPAAAIAQPGNSRILVDLQYAQTVLLDAAIHIVVKKNVLFALGECLKH